MAHAAPGKACRKGLTRVQLTDMFPTEEAATQWFETTLWNCSRTCGKCGSTGAREASHSTMPYRCTECRNYFSVRIGTALARSKVPLRKWAIAIDPCVTSLKSVSSVKLHRDIGVSQPIAWIMLHGIREAWADESDYNDRPVPVDADETCVGGTGRAEIS